MTENSARFSQGTSLPGVVRTITQSRLNDYSEASGDRNPLHLDSEFAATTQFGGIIAHGMLTLAFISEMMTSAFGESWLKSGELKVRFKGAAYVGDEVEAWGEVTKDESVASHRVVVCSVGLRNRQDGRELISGTATVKVER